MSEHGLLTETHEDLPFPGHCFGGAQFQDRIQYLVMVMHVWSQEVVIGDPQGQIVVCAFDSIEAVCVTVRRFIGAVEPFDDLLVWTEFRCYGITVRQTDYLSDIKLHLLPETQQELLGGEGIDTVAIGDKAEAFRQFIFEVPKSHAHGQDTGADGSVSGYAVSDD